MRLKIFTLLGILAITLCACTQSKYASETTIVSESEKTYYPSIVQDSTESDLLPISSEPEETNVHEELPHSSNLVTPEESEPEESEQQEVPIQGELPSETVLSVPDRIEIGKSSQEDIAAYYQAHYSNKNVYFRSMDYDGNNYGDLAVWYDGAFRVLYLMGEDNLLKKEYSLEEGFEFYYASSNRGIQVEYQVGIPGTVKEQDGVLCHKFFDIEPDGLYLRECIKYDPNDRESNWFRAKIGAQALRYDAIIEEWDPISQQEFQDILSVYQVDAYSLTQF